MEIYSTLKIYDVDKKTHLDFDRNEYLRQKVKGKTVLHVGCSDFPITKQRIKEKTLLHLMLQSTAKKVVGIDLSEEGIGVLKENGIDNVFAMDAENIDLSDKFDVILAGDVLEHLNNPGLFLEKASSLLNPGGEVIIGVPSALTFNNLRTWLLGRELVHVDHTFYFSPKTLSGLCARFDLLPTRLVFTVQEPVSSDSATFVFLRKTILKMIRSMAPSIIMHFKLSDEVDKNGYVEWK